tara:strand:+ start:185 stop:442 length:258 start_codon:yes stop_codon:yes gene_type:complete
MSEEDIDIPTEAGSSVGYPFVVVTEQGGGQDQALKSSESEEIRSSAKQEQNSKEWLSRIKSKQEAASPDVFMRIREQHSKSKQGS